MAHHRIVVTVKFDGTFTSEIQGVKGPACTEIAKLLEAVGTVIEDKPTPEFDERDPSTVSNTVLA